MMADSAPKAPPLEGLKSSSASSRADWLEGLLNRQPRENERPTVDSSSDDSSASSDDEGGMNLNGRINASRYTTEFKELALVGWGGGGEVWKVVNRLDRRFYAIKKITLDPLDKKLNEKIRREVTTISRLLHNHVVRYYAAWVEEGSRSGDKGRKIQKARVTGSMDTESSLVRKMDPINEEDSLGISFDRSGESADHFQHMESSPGASQKVSETPRKSAAAMGHSQTPSSFAYGKAPSMSDRVLYIQMEYCYATLQEAIVGNKLWTNEMEISRLFLQLLDAVEYVHSMRVIHRDLKPANIFLDSLGNIKIGDFGLATTDIGYDLYGDIDQSVGLGGLAIDSSSVAEHIRLPPLPDFDDPLTMGVGTALYRAPEQGLSGKAAIRCKNLDRHYDSKADIYSLGIVLFEMCHPPFATGMERIEAIKALRESKLLPDRFKEACPKYFQHLILWMVDASPCSRPAAAEISGSAIIEQHMVLEHHSSGRIQQMQRRDSDAVSKGSATTAEASESYFGDGDTIRSTPMIPDFNQMTTVNTSLRYSAIRAWGTLLYTLSAAEDEAGRKLAANHFFEFMNRTSKLERELFCKLCTDVVVPSRTECSSLDSRSDSNHWRYALVHCVTDDKFDMINFSPVCLKEIITNSATMIR